jgi:signal peptidase
MVWKSLCIITGCTHPIMVVSSESMEPAFRRGDVILLWNRKAGLFAGDIPVIWFSGRPLPMVHRAIQVVNTGSVSGYYVYLP